MPNDEQVVGAGNGGGARGARRHLAKIDPPGPIDVSCDREENFRKFKSRWENYAILTRLAEEKEEYQVALLEYVVGAECTKIIDAASLTEKTTQKVLEVLEKYCVGDTNVIHERYVFNTRNQLTDEDFDTYLTRLRELANRCNYGTYKDELIRDRIVWGVKSDDVRHKLIAEGN
jgi:hypothetical protein